MTLQVMPAPYQLPAAVSREVLLSDPDGVDLVPPDSLLVTHGATMGAP